MLSLDNCFFDVVQSALPSIPLDKIENVKKAVNQFNFYGKEFKFTMKSLDVFSQGDIITGIPFINYDRDGNQIIGIYNAITLSNTCDIQRNENILFCPIFPANEYNRVNVLDLKKNYIYEYMYFEDTDIGDCYVNFGNINSINRLMIEEGIRLNRYKRLCSLTDIGYYMFILKLTIFLMRSEDTVNFTQREKIY